jgi:hypothetical protein
VHYEVDKTLAALFETRFEAMWERATNRMAPPRSKQGCRVQEGLVFGHCESGNVGHS